MFLFYYLIKLRGIVFQRMLLDILDPEPQGSFPERNLDDVPNLYVVGSFCIPAVDLNMLGITGIVRYCPSFDDSGYL